MRRGECAGARRNWADCHSLSTTLTRAASPFHESRGEFCEHCNHILGQFVQWPRVCDARGGQVRRGCASTTCPRGEATFRRFNFCIATRKCDHPCTTHRKFAGYTKQGKVRVSTPAVSMKLLLHTSSTHSVGSRWSPSAAKASGTVAIAGTGTFNTTFLLVR